MNRNGAESSPTAVSPLASMTAIRRRAKRLLLAEGRYFTSIVRRPTEIVLPGPRLNANYAPAW